jgi:CcmD family protein
MYKKSAILILLFATVSKTLSAQTATTAEKLLEHGKLNTVIAVFAFILVGIFAFLFYLERKIRKLEQEVKN